MVRQRSAKPRFGGSIPPAASSFAHAGGVEVARYRRGQRVDARIVGFAVLVGLTLCPQSMTSIAAIQQEATPPDQPSLEWTPWISDVPVVDMTGEWVFDSASSDPMVEVWRQREVVYQIDQQTDRIVFEFRPENGQRNVQTYRWAGSISEFQRGGAEVRERARWTERGRVLEVEGRWWAFDDLSTVRRYTFRYEVASFDMLVFTQGDEYGTTMWRFRRRR